MSVPGAGGGFLLSPGMAAVPVLIGLEMPTSHPAAASLRISVCRQLNTLPLAGYLSPSIWGRDDAELPNSAAFRRWAAAPGCVLCPGALRKGRRGRSSPFSAKGATGRARHGGERFGSEVAPPPPRPPGSVQRWPVVGQSVVPRQEQQQDAPEAFIRRLATARSALRGLNTFAL